MAENVEDSVVASKCPQEGLSDRHTHQPLALLAPLSLCMLSKETFCYFVPRILPPLHIELLILINSDRKVLKPVCLVLFCLESD